MHKLTRRDREKAASAVAERQARHDALVRPYLQDLVAGGGGLATAVARLTAAGVPAPRRGATWSRKAVWRICQRLGILLAVPGGLAEAVEQLPRCHRCGRQVRLFKLRRVCRRCQDAAWKAQSVRDLRQLEREAKADPPPRLGPGVPSLQKSAKRKRKHRHPRKRFGKPVDK